MTQLPRDFSTLLPIDKKQEEPRDLSAILPATPSVEPTAPDSIKLRQLSSLLPDITVPAEPTKVRPLTPK